MRNLDLDFAELAAFDAIFEHRSVIKAARALGLPQPTVSRWLAKLREHFDDPLFVRTQLGMEPTPVALACAEPVADILRIHRTQLLNAGRFDPATTTRNFRIAASDFGHFLVIPRLHAWSRETAPSARFTAAPLGRKMLITELESGEVDLAVGGFPNLFAGVLEQTLYEDRYVCVMRDGHPLLKRPLTLEGFRDAGHILVRTRDLGHVHQEVEKLIADLCPPEKIMVVSETFLMAALFIGDSDLILTVPARVATLFQEQRRLVSVPPPMDLPPFQVKQYWHQRFHKDPGNQWLRRAVAAHCT